VSFTLLRSANMACFGGSKRDRAEMTTFAEQVFESRYSRWTGSGTVRSPRPCALDASSLSRPSIHHDFSTPDPFYDYRPRTLGDYEPMDEGPPLPAPLSSSHPQLTLLLFTVYNALDSTDLKADYTSFRNRETRAERKAREKQVFGVDNEARKARSAEEMEMEARRLSGLFPLEKRGVFE
jgi:hypothetical protein